MTEKKIECPGCRKQLSERGLKLHIQKALSGWDPIWDITMPHTKWARGIGIDVGDNGCAFDMEKLNNEIDIYICNQKL